MKSRIESLISDAVSALVSQNVLPADANPKVVVTRTKERAHGDFASNIALAAAKTAGMAPRELAGKLVDELSRAPELDKIEIAGPGFINFFVASDNLTSVIADVLDQGAKFGCSDSGQGRRIMVEFVSANPTGPLHVGHGRGAAIGDSLCRLLNATGWNASAEFYYNDAGQQMTNLALSTQARCKGLGPDDPSWPQDGYRGDYIIDVASAYMNEETVDAEDKHVTGAADTDNLEAIEEFAVAYLRREQDRDLNAFAVKFDTYFLESSLYNSGEVEETVTRLIESDSTYEQDGALWLRTTGYGDDKDRVMRKSSGHYTYFVPDVAYHLNKWRRGFAHVINEQGADHHSTITRVRAGVQAFSKHQSLDIPEGYPDYVLHQMVLVKRGGKEVKLSKRAGSYVTLRDLIDEVGRDATRYFLVARAATSQLMFDIDLAVSRSNDNPVYYIQYAHARICSVLRQCVEKGFTHDNENGLSHQSSLQSDHEQKIVNELAQYPEVLASAASSREPHRMANYLHELAGTFHAWYNASQFIVEDTNTRDARLTRCLAVKQVLANGLNLLGVSAPEEM
ncbi:MAG: arginine--tRNA ligase [Pseudomonadota bacterium]